MHLTSRPDSSEELSAAAGELHRSRELLAALRERISAHACGADMVPHFDAVVQYLDRLGQGISRLSFRHHTN